MNDDKITRTIFSPFIPDWVNNLPDIVSQPLRDALRASYWLGFQDGLLTGSGIVLVLVVLILLFSWRNKNG